MKGRRTMKHFKPMACILSSVVLLAAMSWSAFADDKPQAKIGNITYSTFAEAASAAKKGDTITLLTDIPDTRVELSKSVNIDGGGHTISGESFIMFSRNGGSITNTNFVNIKKSQDILAPVSCGKDKKATTHLASKLSITNCTFKEVEYDAIRIMPVNKAVITIEGNVFEEKDSTDRANRFIHIEILAQKNDYTATVTNNKMYGTTTAGNLECYGFVYQNKIKLSGNYIENTNASCVLRSSGRENVTEMIYPLCSSDTEMIADKYPVAEIKRSTASYFYDSFADAANAAIDGDTICVYADEIEFAPITKSNITVKGNGAVVKTIQDNSIPKTTKNLTLDGFNFENVGYYDKATNRRWNNLDIKGENFTIKNCNFKGTNGLRTSEVYGTATIDTCDFDTEIYGIHVGGGNGVLNIKKSTLRGWNSFIGTVGINVSDCKFVDTEKPNQYYCFRVNGNATVKNSSFTNNWVTVKTDDSNVGNYSENAVTDFTNCTVTNSTMTELLLERNTSFPGTISVDATKNADGKYISGTILGNNKDSYIADGFEAVDKGNGTYTVAEKKLGGVEITATDAYVDENSGLGNLRYITTATVGENATVEYFGTWFIPSDIFTNSGSSLNVTVQKNEAITNGQTYSADLLSIPADELGRQIIGVSFIKLSGRDDIISSAQKITTVAESEAK